MNRLLIIMATAAVSVSFLLSSCRKKGDNEKLEGPNQSISGLLDTTAGSWWLFGSNEGSVTRRVATGKDSLKLGRRYDYFEKTDTNTQYVTPEYFALNDSNYLMLVDMDGSQTNYINAIVNKANAQVGDTWTNTAQAVYSGLHFDIKMEGKITATGKTETINGVTYTGVTETENTLKVRAQVPPTPWTNCGTIKMSFAKDVGIIRSDFNIHILSFYTRHYTDSLLSYHIEQ